MTEKPHDEPLGGREREAMNTAPEATAKIVTDKIAKKGLHAVKKLTNKLKTLEVKYVPIGSIRPNTYNPNRQNKETLSLLCLSIVEDGFTQPVVVQKESNEIVDGEHRWRAARKMGMTEIPVCFVSMTPAQMKIATLRHNRARGSEDISLSHDLLIDLIELGAGDMMKGSLQMSDGELQDLIVDIPAPEALATEEDFSNAWTPEKGGATEGHIIDDESAEKPTTRLVEVENRNSAAVSAVAMTKGAADDMRARKIAINGANTESERAEIAKNLPRDFRLQVTLSGAEGEMVKTVLGEEPAEKLLEVCRDLEAAMPA